MAKLTFEQLEVLVEKKNKAGVSIVEIMNNEELASYRINCVEAIEREQNRIERTTSETMKQIAREVIETLEKFIKYIDEKLTDEKTGLEVIDQFLEEWKTMAFGYYMNLRNKYNEVRNAEYEVTEENLKCIRDAWGKQRLSDKFIINALEETNEYKIEELKNRIKNAKISNFVKVMKKAELQIVDGMRFGEEGYLNNVLDMEVDRKKAQFINKIESKAGNVVKAELTIGKDGEINGLITGELKTISVKTITAGGYNIQCYHYRMLIKEVK